MAEVILIESSDSEEEQEVPQYHFKILIPATAVGSIMGKNGEVVSKLENTNSAKIVISGLKDCYPGTKERVCLISGSIDSILAVNRIIMKKMIMNPDLCYKGRPGVSRKDPSYRSRQVKLIIPQSTASKIIGKSGGNIEKMKAESGSFIQLSRKAFPVPLRERFVTISGEFESNDLACRMILEIIADETDVGFYKNVSYSQASFPLPNSYMSGPPFANTPYNVNCEMLGNTMTENDMLTFLRTFEDTLKNMAFPEDAILETVEALLTLAQNKVMDVCLSMLINWFYPRAFNVYERNGGVPSLGRSQTGRALEGMARDFSRSMFTVAEYEPRSLFPARLLAANAKPYALKYPAPFRAE